MISRRALLRLLPAPFLAALGVPTADTQAADITAQVQNPLDAPAVRHLGEVAIATLLGAIRATSKTYLAKPVRDAQALYIAFLIPFDEIEGEFHNLMWNYIVPAAMSMAKEIEKQEGGQVYQLLVTGSVRDGKLLLATQTSRGQHTLQDDERELARAKPEHYGLFEGWFS